MIKKILLATLFLTYSNIQTITRQEAIENLGEHTAFRKGLKNQLHLTQLALIPCILTGTIIGAISQKNLLKGALVGLSLPLAYYFLILTIRSSHTWILKQGFLKNCFRKLYNKRVDYYGNIVSPFEVGTENLPYALTDDQFIFYGRASGYSTQELIHLASKSGRLNIINQLNYSDQMTNKKR